ncbi:hypothetical protein [Methanobacterium sp. BAmetb5]|uniref:hypothetical protein n=1 Tax=Methanobacterium sp. BAmetb5 TaxID=2025351 RepID=UPI000E8EB18E|nr:hypothetical protein [Methanobacterium sp. BAmetb5]AXV39992.1 MAG: hypothetical protein CIT02_06535 [Methanobacterium sp. BAmetb5]
MSNNVPHQKIQENLSEIRKRIHENYELQRVFPEEKGLLINLKSLEHMEKDLIEELERSYLQNNVDVFEMHLSGPNISSSTIPISDLGEILHNSQEIITSLSSETPMAKRAPVSKDLIKSTKLYVVATASGSFKIIMSPIQSKLMDSPQVNDTPLNKSFAKFEQLVACGDNKELLIKQIEKIGYKSLLNYKNFLESLYKNSIKIELNGKGKDKNDFKVFKLNSKQSKKIYDVIHAQKESPKKEFVFTGTLKAVDLLSHTFKFVTRDKGKEIVISGKFDKNLEKLIEDRLNKISKVTISSWIDMHELEGEELKKYFLKRFED